MTHQQDFTSGRKDEANDSTDGGDYLENEVLQPLSLQGWFEVPLPTRFTIQRVHQQAPIPSPLAQLRRKHVQALEVALLRISEPVRKLYRSLQAKRADHREYIIAEAAASGEGYTANYAFLSSDQVHKLGDAAITDGRAAHVYVHLPANPIAAPPVNDLHRDQEDHELNGGKALEFRRLANPNTDEIGYFLVNTNLIELSVNQEMINPNTIVGPLPDFCIIEVGKAPIFWWRTPAALDFAPIRSSARVRKRKREHEVSKGACGDEGPLIKKLKAMSDAIQQPSESATGRLKAKGVAPRAEVSLSRADDPSAATASAAPQGTRVDNVNDAQPTGGSASVDNANTYKNGMSAISASRSVAKETNLSTANTNDAMTSTADATQLTSWMSALRRGIIRCRQFPRDPLLSSHTPHVLPDIVNLSDNEVVLAIASVWRSLHEQEIRFAFADSVTFQVCKTQMMVNLTCVGSQRNLVIPLFIGPDEDIESEEQYNIETEPALSSSAFQEAERERHRPSIEAASQLQDHPLSRPPPLPNPSSEPSGNERVSWKGAVGHHVLVLASKQPEDGRIQMTFLDSLVGHRSRGVIRRLARNIVRNSDWLGDTWPTFGSERWPEIAQQHPIHNACGIHSVLNAWAYMLGIHLRPGRNVDPSRFNRNFYRVARLIINLAMQGSMDAGTIRAFMQYHGFSREESLAEWQRAEVNANEIQRRRNVTRTRAMNETILEDYVNLLRQQGT